MADPLAIMLHDLSVEAAPGSGAAVDIGELRSALQLTLKTTVDDQVEYAIETSPDGSTGWRSVGAFQVGRGASSQKRAFDRCDRYVRVTWDGPATFQVAGDAHVLFAVRDDVGGAQLPMKALDGISDCVWADCLIKGSLDAEDAIATSNKLPLTKWPASLSNAVAAIVAYLLMKHRGFDPQGPDQLIVKAYDDAQAWLRRVADGKLKPPGLTPKDNLGVHQSSGNPRAPDVFVRKFSDGWGDF